jgi:membrane protein implicated in regulation of membrane protease activity
VKTEIGVSYDVIGKMGRVTADITPGHLGEVVIEVRQGTEKFTAAASDPDATIKKHTQVLVVGSLGGRTVEVEPTNSMRLPR